MPRQVPAANPRAAVTCLPLRTHKPQLQGAFERVPRFAESGVMCGFETRCRSAHGFGRANTSVGPTLSRLYATPEKAVLGGQRAAGASSRVDGRPLSAT